MAGAPGPRGPIKFLSEEEKKNAPKVTKELILRILSYLRPYWLQLLLVLAAEGISGGIGAVERMLVSGFPAVLLILLIIFRGQGIMGHSEVIFDTWFSKDTYTALFRKEEYSKLAHLLKRSGKTPEDLRSTVSPRVHAWIDGEGKGPTIKQLE